MTKRSREDWRALFEAQAASGMSAAAFCRAQGVDPRYFSVRKRQLLGREPKAQATGFARARVIPGLERIELMTNGGVRLVLPAALPAAYLAELVRALL
jgi:hypothetical protein